MFRLMLVCVLACVMSVRCGTILAPAIGKLVSEKVVESHGNNVVHAAAPALGYTNVALIAAVALPKASLVAGKTIEAHQVIQPLHDVAIPTIAARELTYAAPIYYSAYPQLVAEKTVSSYGHSVQHVA